MPGIDSFVSIPMSVHQGDDAGWLIAELPDHRNRVIDPLHAILEFFSNKGWPVSS